jgi:Ca2+-binding RTX toxin-like protein
VTYANSDGPVTVSLATGQGSGGWATGDRLANVENLTGSQHGDSLTGSSVANMLQGLNGNDTILGDAGNDTIDGGLGNDSILGDAGSDSILGGAGNDTIDGGADADSIDGGGDIDLVSYESSSIGIVAWLDGNAGVYGDAAGDRISNVENLTGSGYNDTLGASSATNHIAGGGGVDIVSYANASAAVTVNLAQPTQSGSNWESGDSYTNVEGVAGSGHNDMLTGDAENNLLYGNAGADTLTGASGDDSLYGGDNDDVLVGGAGADYMDGGGGIDTVSYEGGTAGVAVDLHNNRAIGGDALGDQYSGIERWIATSFGDRFWMGASSTYVNGRDGNDNVSYEFSDASVTVNLLLGHVSGGYAAGDTLVSIESILGSQYGDNLIGSNSTEWLYGEAGNDTLSGGNGNDALYGGYDDDMLSGGDGNDLLRGDVGSDMIDGGAGYDTYVIDEHSYAGTFVTVYVDGRTSTVVGGDGAAAGDTAINVERVIGGSANETVVAYGALQRFDGGEGVDTIDLRGSMEGVTVDLTKALGAAQISAGLASGFVLTGVESVLGTGYADTLSGDSGNNTLGGLGGADVLIGNGGNDTFRLTASQLTGSTPDLVRVDGGAGYDAIEISGLLANQSVSLAHLLSTNGSGQQVGASIEHVGLRDGLVQNVTISAADVQALVGAGNSSTLTLRVDNGDFVTVDGGYTTASAGGVAIYEDVNRTQQIAQINYLTA